MTGSETKDSYSRLGTESAALREELDRLTAALEQAAKAGGEEAVKAVSGAARDILARATAIVDGLPDKAAAAREAAADQRAELENAIREKPLLSIGVAALAGFVLATLVRR